MTVDPESLSIFRLLGSTPETAVQRLDWISGNISPHAIHRKLGDKITRLANPDLAHGRDALALVSSYSSGGGAGYPLHELKEHGKELARAAERASNSGDHAAAATFNGAEEGYDRPERVGMASRLVSVACDSSIKPAERLADLDLIRSTPVPKEFGTLEADLLTLAKTTLAKLETGEGDPLPKAIMDEFSKRKAATEAEAAVEVPQSLRTR